MRSIESLRADTPGTATRLHLNSAGASLMPTPVIRAIQDHIDLEASIGGYEAAAAVGDRISATYDSLARLIGAEPHQIALTEHATQSFVQALSSIPLRAGDTILTSIQDYNSNQIQYLSLADRTGVKVVRAPANHHGALDAAATCEVIHRIRPRAVALTHIPTNSGMIQPLDGIGAACREADAWYLVDACQTIGQLPVNVDALQCDFLSSTARKFLRGPRGAGFLYVSDRALDAGLTPLFPDLRGVDWIDADLTQPALDARRFESWEFAWALVLGMGAAADYALEVGVEEGGRRAIELAAGLRDRLSEIDGVRVLDRGPELCAIVTISLEGGGEEQMMHELRARSINTTFQDRVSAPIDFDQKGIENLLRLSPHYFNTEDELDRAAEAVRQILSGR